MCMKSIHSIDRIRERCNLKQDRLAMRNIQLAFERGKRADDLTSWEREYLANEGHGNCSAIAYNNYCYIVSENNVCVTVYALPKWFGQKKHFDGKERIRDYKKYCRSNRMHIEYWN